MNTNRKKLKKFYNVSVSHSKLQGIESKMVLSAIEK